MTDKARNERVRARIREAQADATRRILESDPTDLSGLADNAAGFAEVATDKHSAPGSFTEACRPGCHWCCYQMVAITPPEAFRIARYIQDSPDADKIIARLRELDRQTRGKSARRRDKMRLPCAFLEDGLCGIYEVRPLVCAGFNSENEKDCKRAYRRGFGPDSINRETARMVAYEGVLQGLMNGLVEIMPRAEIALLELSAAVLTVIDNENAESDWAAGKAIFSRANVE